MTKFFALLLALVAVLSLTLTGCKAQGPCHGHGGVAGIISGIYRCADGTEV